jgi:serine/threonine protein kinase
LFDCEYRPRICALGSNRPPGLDAILTVKDGNALYTAPELLGGDSELPEYTEKVDVYSFGRIFMKLRAVVLRSPMFVSGGGNLRDRSEESGRPLARAFSLRFGR